MNSGEHRSFQLVISKALWTLPRVGGYLGEANIRWGRTPEGGGWVVRQCPHPHVLLLPVRMSPDGTGEPGADVGASLGD